MIPVAAVIATVSLGALWRLSQTGLGLVTWEAVTRSEALPLGALCLLRSVCAGVALWTLLCVYRHQTGITLRYQDASVVLRRHTRFTTFTVWCFVVLGGYFLLAAWCSGAILVGAEALVPSWLATSTLVLFAVGYPMSLLVSAVVTFVLLPMAQRQHYPTAHLFRWRPLMMHSGNVIMMQLAMLSAPPPLTMTYLPWVLLFGCSYALFAWYWFRRTGIFYYFFLDYRRPAALWTYLGLVVAIALLYGLSNGIAHLVLQQADHWWTYPSLALLTLSLIRVRASDPARPLLPRETPHV